MKIRVQHATHIGWGELAECFRDLLANTLNRDIEVEALREDYYYWHISLCEQSLSVAEQERLFTLAGADDFDREANCIEGGYPISEIAQGLARKMMSLSLPFTAETSFADDNGVWFTSPN